MHKSLLKPLVLALAGAPLPVAAQDILDEQDMLMALPEVMSVARLPQKRTETPAAITVIDRDMIRASSAVNVPDLFRLVPGMQSYQVGYNKFGVTYHGMSDDFPNQMEVMINGRSIYIPLLSTVAWETLGLSLDDIDYIEVVRGSNVAAQGSNALVGAINIVTIDPLAESGQRVRMQTGARNSRALSYRNAGSFSEGDYRVSVGRKQNDGSKRYADEYQNTYVNLNASMTPSLVDTLDVELGFSDGFSYVGQADEDPVNAPKELYARRDFQSSHQSLRWRRLLDSGDSIQLSAYHNVLDLSVDKLPIENVLLREQGIDEPTAKQLADAQALVKLWGLNGTYFFPDNEHGRSELYDFELQYEAQPVDTLQWVTGMGYRYEKVKSEALLGINEAVNEDRWRMFSHLQYQPAEKWVLHGGAMLENNSLVESKVSSRLAANYLLADNHSLRIAGSRSYRSPSLQELNGQIFIRQNDANNNAVWDTWALKPESLKSEKLEGYELGYFGYWPDQGLQLDVKLYRDHLDRVLGSSFYKDPASDADSDALGPGKPFSDAYYQVDNNTYWDIEGVDLQLTWRPTLNNLLMLSYGYANAEGERDGKGAEKLRVLDDSVPMHTASMLASHKFNQDWQLGLSHFFMSTVAWDEGAKVELPRKAYHRTDIKLSRTISLGSQTSAQASVIVQNLFDDRYAEFYRNNTFDRRTFVSLALNF